MTTEEDLRKFMKNSQLGKILSDKKNFIGSQVQYSQDGKTKVVTVKTTLKGKKYIVTSIVGDDAVDISLSDLKGNIIEHVYHKDNVIFFE